MLDKYASMWKADTPVERQAEARELWDNLTGINHSKEDTTARLERLFPEAKTHNKEAKALSKEEIEKENAKQRAIAELQLEGGAAAGLGGGALLKSSVPDITGRTSIYHGTTPEAMEEIRKSGLQSRKRRGVADAADSLTSAVTPDYVNEGSKDLVFGHTNKTQGGMYAAQQRAAREIAKKEGIPYSEAMRKLMAPGLLGSNEYQNEYLKRDKSLLEQFAGSLVGDDTRKTDNITKADKKNVAKFNVPLWKLREQGLIVDNPELAEQLRRHHRKLTLENELTRGPKLTDAEIADKMEKFKRTASLGEGGGTYTFKGGLDAEYLAGSDKYKRLSPSEMLEYASKNKKQFAKGVGKAGLGTGLIYGGYRGIKGAINRIKKLKDSEKKAGLSARDLEKLMIGTGIGVGGTYGGMTGYSKLKKNKQGYSKARIDLTADEAARAVREEMGDLPPGKIKQKLINARRKAVDAAEENPLAATAALALAGSTVGGLSARSVAKRIKDSVK